MPERLEDQIRQRAEAMYEASTPIEDLLPSGVADQEEQKLNWEDEIVLLRRPSRRSRAMPGWAVGLAAAAAVLVVALPLTLFVANSGQDVADQPATTSQVATSQVAENPKLAQNPANRHFYEAVTVPGGMTWDEARAAAEERTVGGVTGHLATFISADEYEFVVARLPNGLDEGYWLGGFQLENSPNEPDGDWQWVTGEPFEFTIWAEGEPNDSAEAEQCLQPSPADAPRWNDQPCDDATIRGYVVEYDTSG